MISAPRLSVVMPVHNGMPFIGESVASIVAQSFGDFELVLGDDGSDDGTSETLTDWARCDPRIRIVRRDRKSGLAASANWVVSMSRAPIVAIAHADDVSHPDRFDRQIALLDAYPDVAAIGTLAQGIDASGRRVHPPSYWGLVPRSPFAPFSHSSIMMRRASFDLAGGYRAEAEYWEDLDLYWRLLRAGRILVIPQALASYRYSAQFAEHYHWPGWNRFRYHAGVHRSGPGRHGADCHVYQSGWPAERRREPLHRNSLQRNP